jgi:hypothetical protein
MSFYALNNYFSVCFKYIKTVIDRKVIIQIDAVLIERNPFVIKKIMKTPNKTAFIKFQILDVFSESIILNF